MNTVEKEIEKNQKIELLAPAGSLEVLKTAVHAGADAIYIGGPAYSARAGAKNFDKGEMVEAINYARFYQRKLLIAANTLVKDQELSSYISYLEFLAQHSPDAIIIQDLGLIEITKKYVPELPIHASTQLTVSNRYGVQMLKEMGIRRVVLARELSLAEIKAIKDSHPDIEIEVFVHGAQCICYSGQCLMSSMIGGRSGNRGQCAQPCRLSYQLLEGNDRLNLTEAREVNSTEKTGQREARRTTNSKDSAASLISPKDLYGLPLIEELVDAGVNTLKIEGRLKNKNYVYQTVSSYRQAIDNYYEDLLTDQNDFTDKDLSVRGVEAYKLFVKSDKTSQKIAQTFNREFSSAYLLGSLGSDLISLDRPNNKGRLIGKLIKYQPQERKIIIEIDQDLVLGDGIFIDAESGGMGFAIDKMWSQGQEITELRKVGRVQLNINSRQLVPLSKGNLIYKSYDKELALEIEDADMAKRIGINFSLEARLGQPLTLKYVDESGYQGQIVDEYLVQEARKHPSDFNMIRDQLGRLGESPYFLEKMEVDLNTEYPIMIPTSVLNRIRREAVEKCNRQRSEVQPYKFISNPQIITPGHLNMAALMKEDRQGEVLAAKDAASTKQALQRAKLVAKIASPDLVQGLEPAYQEIYYDGSWQDISNLVRKSEHRPVLACLSAMIKESKVDELKDQIRQAIQDGVSGFVLNQVGQKELIESIISELEVTSYREKPLSFVYDFGMNVFNQETYNFLVQTDIDDTILSLELNKKELDNFQGRGAIYLHSRYRLMISEYSLLSSYGLELKQGQEQSFYLEDRKGYRMPVRENSLGQLEIYNAQITSLLAEMQEIIVAGRESVIIDVSRDFLQSDLSRKSLSIYAQAYEEIYRNLEIKRPPEVEHFQSNANLLKSIYQGQLTKGHYNRGVK